MNTFVIYYFNAYAVPKIQTREVQSPDIVTAIQAAGVAYAEILAVKLKGVTDTVVGI